MGGFDDYTLAGGPIAGPTGAVSWATHRPSGRAVSVTELAREAASDDAFLVRLRSTAAALASAPHPNVLPIREVVEGPADDGSRRVWVVEDWVEGRELGDVMAEGPLTPEQTVAVACGALRGLAAMQALGVVHGDVSPRTVVITAAGVPQVAGFGFAGMPGSGPADARRDVVRLATVLRQLLAAGPSTASRKAAHRQLDKAVDRAVSGDGKRPPADAPAFLAALEQAARTDFGKRWAERTPLAPLAAAPSPGSAPEVEPAAAAIIEADEIPVDDARPMAVDEPAPPAEPAPAAAVRADDRPEPAVSTKWGDNVPVPDPGSADAGPGGDRGRSGDDRRPRRRRLVRAMSGVILILLGAGVAVAVERIQSTDARSDDARVSGAARTLSGPTPAEIEASDITGTWDMKLVVVESTGFFGTQVGNSVEKIYTVTSDCSARPCSYTLVVTGQPGEFELRQDPDGYVLSESGPNDCIDLPAGTVRVRNGGVASVQAHLRPSGAARTPRGDWAATGLTGSIVTTFDTSHPGCVQGPGVQRSTVTGTRR